MNEQKNQVMTEKESVLEKKVNKIYEARKRINEPSPIKKEMDIIRDRVSKGEVISDEEMAIFQEKFDRSEIRANLMMAEQKPLLDKLMGKSRLEELGKKAQVDELSVYMSEGKEHLDPIEKALIDQFAATHALGMSLIGGLYDHEELTGEMINEFTRSSSKMMRLSHQTIEMLQKYRTGGKQVMTVQHQYIQVNHAVNGTSVKEINDNNGGGYLEENAKTTSCINDMLTEAAKEKVRG